MGERGRRSSCAGGRAWAATMGKQGRAKARRRDASALATKRDGLASAAAMARSPREFTYKDGAMVAVKR